MTDAVMLVLTFGINTYAAQNKTVPPSLDVLPTGQDKVNTTLDGWGRKIEYRVTEEGIITLTSFGADGKPGGNGEDADISESYYSKRPDGSLWVGSESWPFEARVPTGNS